MPRPRETRLVCSGPSWPTHPIWLLRLRGRAAARWIALSELYPRRPWSALGSSLVSQGVSKTINILADSLDRLNGASRYGDAATGQARAENDVAHSLVKSRQGPSHIRQG